MLLRPIWLVGHSYPGKWVADLKAPLDPRHPTRNSIWTPVLESIQHEVYRGGHRRRFDMDKAFVFNAAAKQEHGTLPDWSDDAMKVRGKILSNYFEKYRPPIVITFGRDVYRFVMQAKEGNSSPLMKADELGKSFQRAVLNYDPDEINVFPLLHQYVAMKGWTSAGEFYSIDGDINANYFGITGTSIGRILNLYGSELPIWVD